MTALLRPSIFIVLAFAALTSVSAQVPAGTPEELLTRLLKAMYANDAVAYNDLTIEHPLRARLTAGGRPNPDGLKRLAEDPEGLQIRELRPLLLKGRPVEPGPNGDAPMGTTGLYMMAHGGGPTAVPVVRRADGWKADVRWWVAMSEMMAGRTEASGTPEHTIRRMLAAVLRLDRRQAATLLTDPRGIEALFADAPRQPEPSGVLEAAVMEMPLVEIAAGELYALPGDQVIEGGSTDDRKVFVGMFGPIEIPFVVRRINGSWRVVAEPYFLMMNQ